MKRVALYMIVLAGLLAGAPSALAARRVALVIGNAKYRLDTRPVDPRCPCETCQTVSRSYLRHLFRAKEILYSHLATVHNLTFYAEHIRQLRTQILASAGAYHA